MQGAGQERNFKEIKSKGETAILFQVYLEDSLDEDSATIDFPEFLTLMSKVKGITNNKLCSILINCPDFDKIKIVYWIVRGIPYI